MRMNGDEGDEQTSEKPPTGTGFGYSPQSPRPRCGPEGGTRAPSLVHNHIRATPMGGYDCGESIMTIK